MKAKPINLILLLFTLIFMASCNDMEVKRNDKEAEVRNAVLFYMKRENWGPESYPVQEWEHASVTKTVADDRFKNLDRSYFGEEIYVVTIDDALAAPLIFVDPEKLEVIGIMPGE